MNPLKKLVPYKVILLRRELLPYWRKITKKNMRHKGIIPILHLHLTDHCNLNCRGCDNFSPLAPAVFTDIDVFEKDCKKMSELTNKNIQEIQLLGGEPLLHPNVLGFMTIARKYFPENKISIVSNGILLRKQTDEFWENCKRNNIHITVTKYPVNFDYKSTELYVKAQGVSFAYYGNTESVEKTMQCIPLDMEGKQDPEDSFLRCSRANRCISLDNGKIYTCSVIPYIKYFNSRFNKNLIVSPDDYMTLDNVKNIDEVLNFVSKPMPFCRYCNIKGTIWDIGYGVSKQDISEWTDTKQLTTTDSL